MERWQNTTLGEVLERVIGGGTPSRSKPEYWNGEIPWASVKDMKDGRFVLSQTSEYITQDGLRNSATNLIPTGTVITSTRMGLGRVFRNNVPMAINQDLKALLPKDCLLNDYLLWLIVLNSALIESLGTGTTVKGIRLEQLRSIEVSLPPLSIQRRIAGILSAYDELIENSQRRIKILESMARALYREWFVHFRFPGHESVPRVPSPLGEIPKGWEVKKLGDLFEFVGGSQPPKIEHIHEEKPGYVRFIQNRDYGSSNHLTYIAESRRNKYCDRLDIMVDKYGEPGRTRFGLAGAYNVALAKLLPFAPNHREWLRGLISEPDFNTYLAGASMAATRASLNSSHFAVPVAVPPDEVAKSFCAHIDPLLRLVLSLQDSIANLRRTRDLLLPRLLSGQIDVEAIA